MPEISRFYGIIIRMFFGDHSPPHFHAEYQGSEAYFSIKTGELIGGKFPKNQAKIVTAWAVLRKEELMNNWNALLSEKEFKKIDPLR